MSGLQSDLFGLASGLIKKVSSVHLSTDEATTSPTFETVPGMSVDLDKRLLNSEILIMISASVSISAGKKKAEAQVLIDGAPVVGGSFSLASGSGAQEIVSSGKTMSVSGVPVGQKKIEIQWRTSGGTLRCRSVSESGESFAVTVIEVGNG